MSTGTEITTDQLRSDPYPLLAQLRREQPVSWIPALDGWLVTRYDLAVKVLHDFENFTVDDPRFSTAQVVGPSMLSLDGAIHTHHRKPFVSAFRPSEIQRTFEGWLNGEADRLVRQIAPNGEGELRRRLAGPMAVAVMSRVLGLKEVPPDELLSWYDAIVTAVDRISAGADKGEAGNQAMDSLSQALASAALNHSSLLAEVGESLRPGEVASNAAILLFGGIETAEGMTTNLLWHLLSHPELVGAVRTEPSLLANAIEESLRLEPAAARVDRYATKTADLGGATIAAGDLVIVSITGANRDPAEFDEPDTFDPYRANARKHLSFAQGPHACLGSQLARMETKAAATAVFDLPGLRLDPTRSTPPTGLVFRKPVALWAVWDWQSSD